MAAPAPVPNTTAWWDMMNLAAAGWLNTDIQSRAISEDANLAQQYYDGEECAWRLRAHFGSTTNIDALRLRMWQIYDYYVNTTASPDGAVSGFRMFTWGFLQDFLQSSAQSAASVTNINNILANGAYVNSGNCQNANGEVDGGSREAAYSLEVFINAVLAGAALSAPQIARRQVHFEWCLGHLDQWFTAESEKYISNFMVGITARALILYWAHVATDARILAKLLIAAEDMWNDSWRATSGAWGQGGSFMYRKLYLDPLPPGTASDLDYETAPDLNLLISPLYAWLWLQTGEAVWRQRHDLIFAGAMPVYDGQFYQSGAYLGYDTNPSGKQINQQLTWGPQGIIWAELESVVDGGGDPGEGDPPGDGPGEDEGGGGPGSNPPGPRGGGGGGFMASSTASRPKPRKWNEPIR